MRGYFKQCSKYYFRIEESFYDYNEYRNTLEIICFGSANCFTVFLKHLVYMAIPLNSRIPIQQKTLPFIK